MRILWEGWWSIWGGKGKGETVHFFFSFDRCGHPNLLVIYWHLFVWNVKYEFTRWPNSYTMHLQNTANYCTCWCGAGSSCNTCFFVNKSHVNDQERGTRFHWLKIFHEHNVVTHIHMAVTKCLATTNMMWFRLCAPSHHCRFAIHKLYITVSYHTVKAEQLKVPKIYTTNKMKINYPAVLVGFFIVPEFLHVVTEYYY